MEGWKKGTMEGWKGGRMEVRKPSSKIRWSFLNLESGPSQPLLTWRAAVPCSRGSRTLLRQLRALNTSVEPVLRKC